VRRIAYSAVDDLHSTVDGRWRGQVGLTVEELISLSSQYIEVVSMEIRGDGRAKQEQGRRSD